MKLVRGLCHLPQVKRPCVLTMGCFDALHQGHRGIIDALKILGRQYQLPTTVMLFEPQPREFFQPEQAPPRVYRLRDKLSILKQWGVDQVVCLRFNAALATLSADAFVQEIVVQGLQAHHIIIGADFRYGQARQGNYQHLLACGERLGFTVSQANEVQYQARRISSTWVRAALKESDFALVQQLLGRDYTLFGKVQRGDQMGRQLGFPTVNLRLPNPMAVRGVYVVWVTYAGHRYPGVANVGIRPTVGGQLKRLLEVHLLDTSGDWYGRPIAVTFLKRLRSEQKFADIAALKAQITADVAQAKHYFNIDITR